MSWEEMITVGRIVRPQGNRGEVVVESLSDFARERFQAGAVLHVSRAMRVEDVQLTTSREHGGRWVIGLAGITTIDGAESLRGLELRIEPSQVHELSEGRHYVHDLVGCQVRTEAGEVVGDVAGVRLDAGPLLMVTGKDGEVLIPFNEAICRRVDTSAKVIVIAPPEGLMDVNTRERRGDRGAPVSERVRGSGGTKSPGSE